MYILNLDIFNIYICVRNYTYYISIGKGGSGAPSAKTCHFYFPLKVGLNIIYNKQ